MFYVEEIATYPTVNFSCDYFCFRKGECGYFGLSFKKEKKKSLPNNISQNRKLLNRINRFINKVLFSSFPLSGTLKDKRQV